MVKVKERVIGAKKARRFERIDLAASSRGISQALIRKLFNQGRLTRFKLGSATMVDANELEKLIVADVSGNHGPDAAPQASRK